LSARAGKSKALIATARKLAILYYKTIRYGMEFEEHGDLAYQHASRERQIHGLEKPARALGYQLVATG